MFRCVYEKVGSAQYFVSTLACTPPPPTATQDLIPTATTSSATQDLIPTATTSSTSTPAPLTAAVNPDSDLNSLPKTMANFGDTFPIQGYSGLNMTLFSWQESNHVVVGPYIGGFFTFHTRPEMKFINIQYLLANTGIEKATTPDLRGEVAVINNQGQRYGGWTPTNGINSEENNPRPSTTGEVELLGGREHAYENLLPGQSITGRIVFEIPQDTAPVRSVAGFFPILISFTVGETMVEPVPTPTPTPVGETMVEPVPTPTTVRETDPTPTPAFWPVPALPPWLNNLSSTATGQAQPQKISKSPSSAIKV